MPITIKPLYDVIADKASKDPPNMLSALMSKLVSKVGLTKSVAINFGVGFAGPQLALLYQAIAFGDQRVIQSIGGNITEFGQSLIEEAKKSL
jgi:hypothetical protein